MPTGPRRLAHEAEIAARLAWRALARRVRDPGPAPAGDAGFRSSLEPWVAALPPDLLAEHSFHYLPASKPPWLDSGIDLDAGDTVTLLAAGRVFVSRLLDIWVPPAFQLWCRVGDAGPVLRDTRDTHTFVAERPGRLWLGGSFPGEWRALGARAALAARH